MCQFSQTACMRYGTVQLTLVLRAHASASVHASATVLGPRYTGIFPTHRRQRALGHVRSRLRTTANCSH